MQIGAYVFSYSLLHAVFAARDGHTLRERAVGAVTHAARWKNGSAMKRSAVCSARLR